MQNDGWTHTCLSPQSVVAIKLHSMLIIQSQQAPHNLPKKIRLMAFCFCIWHQICLQELEKKPPKKPNPDFIAE